ncbi:MAG: hypothetical protein DMG65_22485 [Candidatus Angelobacter sp. Gp1-AA117]|nr:MAG: hypothetical protein DMG65_22485 [Candidatus Angelobacter sp. Gp1-AA117]
MQFYQRFSLFIYQLLIYPFQPFCVLRIAILKILCFSERNSQVPMFLLAHNLKQNEDVQGLSAEC